MKKLPAVLALVLAAGCAERPSMSVVEDVVAEGGRVHVSFDRPIQGRAVDQYWLVLAPQGSPDHVSDERIFVYRGDLAASLEARRPGRYELRLHGSFPRKQHDVVARRVVVVAPKTVARSD